MSTGVTSASGPSAPPQNRSNTVILSSRFNQENSCIAVATTKGFRVLNCDPFSKCYEFSQERQHSDARREVGQAAGMLTNCCCCRVSLVVLVSLL